MGQGDPGGQHQALARSIRRGSKFPFCECTTTLLRFTNFLAACPLRVKSGDADRIDSLPGTRPVYLKKRTRPAERETA
jgi:hypothetical protein